MPRPLSVYVHFPYCLKKCPYCDFVSYKADADVIPHEAYADAILAELTARAASVGDAVITSVFFGGGTPSLWRAEALGRVVAGLRAALPFAGDAEITVECNPTSLDEAHTGALLTAGVNRLSVGVQSLEAAELAYLGRLHDGEGALAALRGALRAGARRVSADLIFGLPEQTPAAVLAQADRLLALGLRHLSCYQLTIEPGTQFGELARKGRLPLADDGRVAEAFLALDEHLTARGLTHYEISNYAAHGEEARHNLGYWRGQEYLALGCGAYGFLRGEPSGTTRSLRTTAGVRYRNEVDPKAYMAKAQRALPDATTVHTEPLDAETLLRERLMLGLRLAEGFAVHKAEEDLGVRFWTHERTRAADRLRQQARLEGDDALLRIPRAAWLWADDIAARLF